MDNSIFPMTWVEFPYCATRSAAWRISTLRVENEAESTR